MIDKEWLVDVVGGVGLSAPDLDEVRRALAVLADVGAGIQLHFAPFHKESFRTFPGSDLDGACAFVEEHGGSATGIYYALNPVPADLEHTITSAHVSRRRWLLIDVDRNKEHAPDDSATEKEHEQARALASEVRTYLEGQCWPAPLLVDSGNGFHLLYRIDLECGPPSKCPAQKLIAGVLKRLAERFDGKRGLIGAECHDARRIAKLPGTWARRGAQTTSRPWRMCRLLHMPEETQVVTETQLQTLGGSGGASANGQAHVDTVPEWSVPVTSGNQSAYARKVFESECGSLVLAKRGDLNNSAYRAAAACGNFVGAGLLDEEEVFAALLRCLRAAGADNPRVDETVIRRGLEKGKSEPRQVPSDKKSSKQAALPEEIPDISPDDVATIEDLRNAGASVSWLWEWWIPEGVLTAIAAPAGTGKTRFCADLLRRINRGLPWPDGAEMKIPADALSLWVVADNHHDELVTLAETFGIEPNIRINATRADPYGGVTLETPDDYRDLEARIKAVRPELVIIDTVGNATDKNLSKQEDAKAFYWPLQVLARRYRCAILCLTHLNATGQFLGRRVLEKVRVALRMEQYEGEERRRLEVHKTNSKKPSALGVTMGDAGNDYDNNPPEPPTLDPGAGASRERGKPGPVPVKLQACLAWLKKELLIGPTRVSVLRNRAENEGHSPKTLYTARDVLRVIEYKLEGKVWWTLTSDSEEL